MSLGNLVRRLAPSLRRGANRSRLSSLSRKARRNGLGIESLEARQMLTIFYRVNGVGEDLFLSAPVSGSSSEAIVVDFDGTNYMFTAAAGGQFRATNDPDNIVSGDDSDTITVAAADFDDLFVNLFGGDDSITFSTDGPDGYANPMDFEASSGFDTLNVNVPGGVVFQNQQEWSGFDAINVNQNLNVTRGPNLLNDELSYALSIGWQSTSPPVDPPATITLAENVSLRAHDGDLNLRQSTSSYASIVISGTAGANVVSADGLVGGQSSSLRIGDVYADANADLRIQSDGYVFVGGININGALEIIVDADDDEFVSLAPRDSVSARDVTISGGRDDRLDPLHPIRTTRANSAVIVDFMQMRIGTAGFAIPIGGTMAGSDYPQFRVDNSVSLSGSFPGTVLDVSLFGGFIPPVGSTFLIIDKADDTPVVGRFSDLSEDAIFVVDTTKFRISYAGGDGNDVVLTTLPPSPDTTFEITGTTLTVSDVSGFANVLAVSFDGTNLIFDDPNAMLATAVGSSVPGVVSNGGHRLTLPLASGTGGANLTRIVVNAGGGDDTLTLDQGATAASRLPCDIEYNGGAGGNDTLLFAGGGTFDTVTYNYTNAHSGNVRMDADGPAGSSEWVVSYSELEPLSNAGSATNMVFNLPGTNDNVGLSEIGGMFRLQSNGTFETTDFMAPAAGGTLTVNLGDSTDAITINAVPAGVTTTINGGAGNDRFFIGAPSLAFVANGGDGTDEILGPHVANTWSITGGGSGSIVAGPSFAEMENITGGIQNDEFNVIGSHIGNINGTSGNDVFNISGVVLDGGLSGGQGDDTFNLITQASITGNVDGSSGSDVVNFTFATDARSITVTGVGSIDGFTGTDASIGGVFFNVNSIVGSANVDSWANGISASPATWEIDGTNRFLASGRELAFSAIENLAGSASVDTFNVTAAHTGNLTGNGGDDAFNITGVALTGSIVGSGDNDTLTLSGAASITGSFDGGAGVGDAINFATITGARNITLTALGATDGFNGTEAAIGGGFTNVNSITGSAATDSLTNSLVPAAAATWEIDGTNRFQSGGRDLAFSAIENLNGGSLVDTFNVTAAHTGNLSGNGGNDVFNVTGVLVTGNLSGNAGDDTFNFSGAADVTGMIDGEAGDLDALTLTGSATNVTHRFDNANDGQVDIDGRTLDYVGLDPIVDNLSAVNRVFTFAAATGDDITLEDDGVAANGISRIRSVSSSETVDFVNPTGSLTVNAGVGDDTVVVNAMDSFGGAPTLTINGGAGDDTITVNAVPTPVGNVVNGDADTDTLVGPNTNSTWNVTGGGSGNIVATLAFATMENLTGRDGVDTFNISGNHTGNIAGGGGNDLFNFSGAAVVTGTLDGQAGDDGLNYSGYASARNVSLTALGATDGFSGTEASITGGFANINAVTGSPLVDSLTNALVPAAAATWEIDGANRFLAASRELAFAAIENLNGGSLVDIFGVTANHTGNLSGNSGNDAFNIDDAVTLTGNISGGTGLDELNLAGTGMVTGSFDGGGDFDTLTGGDVANTWTVNAANAGLMSSVGGGFTNVEILVGGSMADMFHFTAAGTLAGSLDGQGGTDRLNYSGYGSARNVTLTALGMIDGFDGTEASIAAGFRNINELVGTTAHVDSLAGLNAASTWNVAVSKTYVSTNTLAFADFETLSGGSANDTFNVAGANIESGEPNTMSGNDGTDTFTLVLPSNGGFVAAAGTTLTINGGAQPAGTRDTVTIDATADTMGRSPIFRYQSAASGDVDIEGIGTASPTGVDVNTVEQVNYLGDAGNDDDATVFGTLADDDLTVRPLSASAADVFLGGAFNNSVPSGTPGVDGGSNGPDISLAGLLPTGLSASGNGGSDGLTIETPAGAQEITVANVVVAPSMLVETTYADIGKTLNVVTAAGDDMVMIDLPDVVDMGGISPGTTPGGPLPDFVRVLSNGGNDVVKFIDAGPDQDHNTINFADLDPLAAPPAVATESAFQLAATECSLVLAGAGNDTIRNLTNLANAGFSTFSVMDLGDGNDIAFGSNHGRTAFAVGESPFGDVIYGGAGVDMLTAGTQGIKFLFADFDVAGVEHPMAGDVLDGSFNTLATISAGPGDVVNNLVGGFFGFGVTMNVVTWLKAHWLAGNGVVDAQAAKCANWHSSYSGTALGTIAAQSVPDLDTTAADAWYDFHAAASGVLTASATFAPGEHVEIKVFDEHFAPLAWEFSNDGTAVAQTPVVAGAEYYVRVRGVTNDVDLNLTIADPDAIAPMVTAVSLGHSGGSDWFAPSVGSGMQLSSVSRVSDQIRITFSEDVHVSAGDLFVSGVNVADYGVLPGSAGFDYDAATHTATWTLATPISGDKVVVTLSDSVRDLSGNALDGEWSNPLAHDAAISSVFPSGDSTPGGSFALRLNVLDGDINGDGIVNLIDVVQTRDAMGVGLANANADVNGDGAIGVADILHVARQMFRQATLPAGEPISSTPLTTPLSTPSPAAPQAPAAIVVAADGRAATNSESGGTRRTPAATDNGGATTRSSLRRAAAISSGSSSPLATARRIASAPSVDDALASSDAVLDVLDIKVRRRLRHR